MHRILIWTDRHNWLSPDKYPEIHRRFCVSAHNNIQHEPDTYGMLVVDGAILRRQHDTVHQLARDSRTVPLPVIAVGNDCDGEDWEWEDWVFDVISEAPTEKELLRSLRRASSLIDSEKRLLASRADAEQRAEMLEQLNTIGVALSAERDHERLLKLILSKSREVTTADAGSLFLVESIDEPIGPEDKKGDQARVQSRWLVFRLAQNDSREIKFEEEVLQINHDSVAGHVALTGQTLKIEDAYHLPPDLSFTFNGRIDEATGYRSRSMLVVPMQNREGETIGVLQLINKKPNAGIRLGTPASFEKDIVPFSDLDERLVRSLASQAAVSVENNALYQRIEKLFDNFVEASVMAIESRDPVTRGHSRRVAKMTVSLARRTAETETGPYRDLRLRDEEIRELKYAALLHDFGKVGVEERVLKKSKKLRSGEFDIVRERFATIRRSIEVRHLRAMLNRLSIGADATKDEIRALEEGIRRDWVQLDQAWEAVETANEPTVTYFDDFKGIEELGNRRYQDPEGLIKPYLKKWEIQALKITKGTLTERERQEINDHVKNSYDFLRKVPWTRDLQNIPKIARGHHEKLDGTGYPYGLLAEEIPPQTRMMTIADIFDALAAQDRPYKPRVPTETALDILVDMAKHGQLDQDLLDVFIEAKIYLDIE